MNIVFWVVIFTMAVSLWCGLSSLFIKIGRIVKNKVDKMSDIVTYEEENQKEEDKENE